MAVYQGLASKLCVDAPTFAGDYQDRQVSLLQEPHAIHSAVGRCHCSVIRAWMENQYTDYAGETWNKFRERIDSSLPDSLTCGF